MGEFLASLAKALGALAALVVVGGAIWAVAFGGIDEVEARWWGHDQIDDPVVEWFERIRDAAADDHSQENLNAALSLLTYNAREQLKRDIDGGEDLNDVLSFDRTVWSNMAPRDVGQGQVPELKTHVENGERAEVSVSGRFIVRYAIRGCLATDDTFTVKRGDEGWRIDRFPPDIFRPSGRDGECSADEHETSWRPAPSYGRGWKVQDGPDLPGWAGSHLQVVERKVDDKAVIVTPAGAEGKHEQELDQRGRSAINREKRTPDVTAWVSGTGPAEGSKLQFDLGAPVRLARIRLHNGAGIEREKSPFAEHGRIQAATIGTEERAVSVALPDDPAKVVIDCDFGVTRRVLLRVDSGFLGSSGESDVALSDIEFLGMPPPQRQDYTATQSGSALPEPTIMTSSPENPSPELDPEYWYFACSPGLR